MALTGENYTQALAEVRAKRDRPSYAAPRDAKVTS